MPFSLYSPGASYHITIKTIDPFFPYETQLLCILKPLGFLYLSLMSDSWSFVDSSSSPAQTCSYTSFPSSAGTNTKSPKGSMSSFLDLKSCQFHLLDMFHIYSLYPIPTVFALVQVLMMSSQDYNIPLFFQSLTWSSQFSLHLT